MGNRYRQPPSDLIRSQLSITNRIETLENSPRSVATSVDTGSWKFIAANGNQLVKFGELGLGYGAGWVFRRGSNETAAIWLGGSPTNQYFALSDNSGNTLVSDNTDSSQEGLARPYIPYSGVKYSEVITPPVTTTSTSFVSAYVVAGRRQHPIVESYYNISTPVGVSAEVQLRDNASSSIVASDTYPGNTFLLARISGTLSTPLFADFSLDLQFRVSAGAGTISIMHIYSYGKQA